LDTTSTSIQSTLFFLALNPLWQQRVYDEMKEVLGNEVVESREDFDVTHEHIARLECMDCCWKESMRLHPPVPVIGRKLSEDIFLGKLRTRETIKISFIETKLSLIKLHCVYGIIEFR
jgi:cytochrome P450 family 4